MTNRVREHFERLEQPAKHMPSRKIIDKLVREWADIRCKMLIAELSAEIVHILEVVGCPIDRIDIQWGTPMNIELFEHEEE